MCNFSETFKKQGVAALLRIVEVIDLIADLPGRVERELVFERQHSCVFHVPSNFLLPLGVVKNLQDLLQRFEYSLCFFLSTVGVVFVIQLFLIRRISNREVKV